MAGGFLRALAKMKLVEIDESGQPPAPPEKGPPVPADAELDLDEVDRILADEDAKARQAQPKPKAPPRSAPAKPAARAPAAPQRAAAPAQPEPQLDPEPVATGPGGIEEGRPFGDYYEAAGVAPSPYPAEKLLRVLDGLKALDPATRKAAVTAMDAADDSWTMADVILDAQRKLRVLTDSLKSLEQQVGDIVSHAGAEKQKLDDYLAQASDSLRKKMGELERMLQQETAQVVAQKTRLDSDVESAQGSCAREAARIREEMRRLHELCSTFAVGRGGT
jgi:hypothetical protein